MMKALKRIYLIGLLSLIPLSDFAQQDAMYSQYMFNPMAINPAYAGSRRSISSAFLLRQQWAGIDGAPSTASFAIHGPVQGKNFALGFNLVHDELGPLTTDVAYLTYAYHLPVSSGKLSMALRAGLLGGTFDYNLLNYNNPVDRFNQSGNISASTATFDFGLYYYTPNFFAGLAATHLQGEELTFGSDTSANIVSFDQHFLAYSGFAKEINNSLVLKPSIHIKYAPNVPINIDLNASVLIRKVFWFGMSYRHKNAVSIITEYNIKNWIRIGYSYDMVTNRLSRYTNGSHELMLGFDFSLKKDKSVSPRYM